MPHSRFVPASQGPCFLVRNRSPKMMTMKYRLEYETRLIYWAILHRKHVYTKTYCSDDLLYYCVAPWWRSFALKTMSTSSEYVGSAALVWLTDWPMHLSNYFRFFSHLADRWADIDDDDNDEERNLPMFHGLRGGRGCFRTLQELQMFQLESFEIHENFEIKRSSKQTEKYKDSFQRCGAVFVHLGLIDLVMWRCRGWSKLFSGSWGNLRWDREGRPHPLQNPPKLKSRVVLNSLQSNLGGDTHLTRPTLQTDTNRPPGGSTPLGGNAHALGIPGKMYGLIRLYHENGSP